MTEARAGDPVEFTVTISNRSGRTLHAIPGAMIADGLDYIAGTARFGETPVEPVVGGDRLAFRQIEIAATETATLKFTARVSGDVLQGFLDTTASVSDPATGIALIPAAKATVRIGAASQSSCAGVSLRAFDDGNRNGVVEDGETGIPGVRITTGDNAPLTTGPAGTFMTPCVIMSRLGGVDLDLRLDTDTLPEGYFVTTKNPLRVRVGRSETAETVFGAAPARIVRVDLNAAAFRRNATTPDTGMMESLTDLISVLGLEPSILRLTYFSHREDAELAERRLEEVRRMVLDRWAASSGTYDLQVETRLLESDG